MYKIIGGDQKQYGPVSAQDVRRWITEGRLNAASLALPEGGTTWTPLGELPEFADAFPSQAGAAAPPPPGAIPPADVEAWSAEIIARRPVVDIAQCLSSSWKLLTGNFGLLFGACLIVWLVSLVCGHVPVLGPIVWWVLKGVLYGGLYLVFLARIRGQPAALGQVFAGFNVAFGQLMLAGILTSLLTDIGFICCLVLPGLYLFIAWTFSVPLVADKGLEFWPAMELSRKVTTRVWFQMLVLLFVAFLPFIAASGLAVTKTSLSLLPIIVEAINTAQSDPQRIYNLILQAFKANLLLEVPRLVLLLNLPFAAGAVMYAYENLFGPRTARPA